MTTCFACTCCNVDWQVNGWFWTKLMIDLSLFVLGSIQACWNLSPETNGVFRGKPLSTLKPNLDTGFYKLLPKMSLTVSTTLVIDAPTYKKCFSFFKTCSFCGFVNVSLNFQLSQFRSGWSRCRWKAIKWLITTGSWALTLEIVSCKYSSFYGSLYWVSENHLSVSSFLISRKSVCICYNISHSSLHFLFFFNYENIVSFIPVVVIALIICVLPVYISTRVAHQVPFRCYIFSHPCYIYFSDLLVS